MFRYRFALPVLLTISTLFVSAQPTPGLMGRVEGQTYISPGGDFQIHIPVLPELGGVISDTDTVVVFRDDYSVHLSIGAFPQDATQRWDLSTSGLREYLPKFFGGFVMPDFRKMFPGATVEAAFFQPDTLGGALLCYTLLPGGSMFSTQLGNFESEQAPVVAKRGNLVFIQNHKVYVISVELTERSLEGSQYNKTPEEEDVLLRKRLAEVLWGMSFYQTEE